MCVTTTTSSDNDNNSSSSQRIIYLNGQYIPESEAKVSVFDRGFLFSDGVYEVTSVINGKLIDFNGHIQRLHRSLNELMYTNEQIISYFNEKILYEIHKELIQRNNLHEGIIYMQITRGSTGDRNFLFTSSNNNINILQPTIVLFTQTKQLIYNPQAQNGIRIITVPDIRWKRCDIKTIQLLSQSLIKEQAKVAGVDDAWMIDDNEYITEGSSNNAFIIKDNVIITRQLNNDILHGITRSTILRLIEENNENNNISIIERPFTIQEIIEADEVFSTSSSTFVLPIVEINNNIIGNGKPGPITIQLRKLYINECMKKQQQQQQQSKCYIE